MGGAKPKVDHTRLIERWVNLFLNGKSRKEDTDTAGGMEVNGSEPLTHIRAIMI